MKILLVMLAFWVTNTIVRAVPIQFREELQTAVNTTADINKAYPNIKEYGDNLYGGVGVEDSAAQPGGKNGDLWLAFQTGNRGKKAAINIDLGQHFKVTDGDSLQVNFQLGA